MVEESKLLGVWTVGFSGTPTIHKYILVKFQPIAWKIVLLLYIKFDKENKKNQ